MLVWQLNVRVFLCFIVLLIIRSALLVLSWLFINMVHSLIIISDARYSHVVESLQPS